MHYYVLLHPQPTIISFESNTVISTPIPPLVLLSYNVDLAKRLESFLSGQSLFFIAFYLGSFLKSALACCKM